MEKDIAEKAFWEFKNGFPELVPLAFQWDMLETIGYERIKATLSANAISPADNRAVAIQWLNEQEKAIQDEIARQHRENSERSLATAERAATATKTAAYWAAVAAFISTISLALPHIPDLIKWYFDWLGQ